MLTVNVHEAKSQLSKLLEAVEAGPEVTLSLIHISEPPRPY